MMKQTNKAVPIAGIPIVRNKRMNWTIEFWQGMPKDEIWINDPNGILRVINIGSTYETTIKVNEPPFRAPPSLPIKPNNSNELKNVVKKLAFQHKNGYITSVETIKPNQTPKQR